MKRSRTFLLALLIFFSSPVFSQLINGSIAPDFNLRDMSGVYHHLYDMLDSGKTVILDFSTVWCHGCWVYHHTDKSLEKAWNAWGPPGENRLRIFFIESDSSNLACLMGDTANCNNQYKTLGNWVDGTPYPIVMTNAPSNGGNTRAILTPYRVVYYPLIYMICPNRMVRIIGTADTAHIRQFMNGCPPPVSHDNYARIFHYFDPSGFRCDALVPAKFVLQNYGRDTLKSCRIYSYIDNVLKDSLAWSGSLPRCLFDTVTIPSIVTPNGIHRYRITLAAANGIDSLPNPMDSASGKFSVFTQAFPAPLSETFHDTLFPPLYWTVTPALYEGEQSWRRSVFSYCTAAHLDFGLMRKDSAMEMFLPPLDLTTLGTPYLTFELAMAKFNDHNPDSLIVYGADNCSSPGKKLFSGNTFTLFTALDTLPDFNPTPDQWRFVAVDLSAVKNSNKCILDFRGVCGPNHSLYIRNIRVYNSNSIDPRHPADPCLVFPNPCRSEISISFNTDLASDVVCNIHDLTGHLLITKQFPQPCMGNKTLELNLGSLSPGVYFLSVSFQGTMTMKKIVVVR